MLKDHVHNLAEILAELNATYFHNACKVRIAWAKQVARPQPRPANRLINLLSRPKWWRAAAYQVAGRPRRSLQLGSYVPEKSLIRIHPCLDQEFVPRFYVASVIYHEMLHEILGVEIINKRRYFHSPTFMALERSYPDYAKAKKWEETHLAWLLSTAG